MITTTARSTTLLLLALAAGACDLVFGPRVTDGRPCTRTADCAPDLLCLDGVCGGEGEGEVGEGEGEGEEGEGEGEGEGPAAPTALHGENVTIEDVAMGAQGQAIVQLTTRSTGPYALTDVGTGTAVTLPMTLEPFTLYVLAWRDGEVLWMARVTAPPFANILASVSAEAVVADANHVYLAVEVGDDAATLVSSEDLADEVTLLANRTVAVALDPQTGAVQWDAIGIDAEDATTATPAPNGQGLALAIPYSASVPFAGLPSTTAQNIAVAQLGGALGAVQWSRAVGTDRGPIGDGLNIATIRSAGSPAGDVYLLIDAQFPSSVRALGEACARVDTPSVGSRTAVLFRFNADGDCLWEVSVPAPPSGAFYGLGTLQATNDAVFVAGKDDGGNLRAAIAVLSAATGAPLDADTPSLENVDFVGSLEGVADGMRAVLYADGSDADVATASFLDLDLAATQTPGRGDHYVVDFGETRTGVTVRSHIRVTDLGSGNLFASSSSALGSVLLLRSVGAEVVVDGRATFDTLELGDDRFVLLVPIAAVP